MAKTVKTDLPVLVVGAGIGGLTAGLCLSRIGYRVLILDQASELKEVGAGIQLGCNAFRAFALLGLEAAIARNAVFPDRYVMRDALSGEEVTHLPLGDTAHARFGFRYGLTHRHDLQQVLIDACRAAPRIELLLNRKVTGFFDDGERVRIETQDGTKHTGAALVGADGLSSMIRVALHGEEAKLHPWGHATYRAVLPIEEVPEPLRAHRVELWVGPRTHMIYYPLRSGRLFNLAAVFHSDRFEEGSTSWGNPAELQERFAGHHPTILQMLGHIQESRYWPGVDREPIKEWSKGRVTLLGDAAHPMLQYMAQGGCMAIEDAVILADKVRAHEGDFARAFVAYQEARYLRTARVALSARAYGHVIHAAGVARELRNSLLKTQVPRATLEALAWLYDGVQVHPDTAADLAGD